MRGHAGATKATARVLFTVFVTTPPEGCVSTRKNSEEIHEDVPRLKNYSYESFQDGLFFLEQRRLKGDLTEEI